MPLLRFGWSDLRVVRQGPWKYIQAPQPELYDLAKDPAEQTNLFGVASKKAQAFRTTLERFLAAERAAPREIEGAAVPADVIEKLGALGYIGGGAAAQTATPGADPKDKIQDFRVANALMGEGLQLLHEGEYRQSVDRLRAVLRRQIQSFELHLYLGRALLGLNKYGDAAGHFEEATRRMPTHAGSWEGLAECRRALGNPRGAIRTLRQGQQALPREAALRTREAALWRELNEPVRARSAYESALPLAPRDASVRARLGELLRDLGEFDAAIERLEEAVALDPGPASSWTTLGMTLDGAGRLADAERAFREAWKRNDASHLNAYNLGLVLLRQGRLAEAREFLEQTLALEPSFTPARQRLSELGS